MKNFERVHERCMRNISGFPLKSRKWHDAAGTLRISLNSPLYPVVEKFKQADKQLQKRNEITHPCEFDKFKLVHSVQQMQPFEYDHRKCHQYIPATEGSRGKKGGKKDSSGIICKESSYENTHFQIYRRQRLFPTFWPVLKTTHTRCICLWMRGCYTAHLWQWIGPWCLAESLLATILLAIDPPDNDRWVLRRWRPLWSLLRPPFVKRLGLL